MTPPGDIRFLLTASEAYPELERLFLAAQDRIDASFLVFDLTTRLRSPEARAVGRTWFDLVEHTLARGVRLSFVVSDLDPVMRAEMHRATWRTVRMFHAAAEIAGAHDRLRIVPAMHASETGLLPRLAFWPVIHLRLRKTARWLNTLAPAVREAALREMPGVARRMRFRPDGTVRPRRWPIPRLFPGTHHQKLCLVDRRWLYIGGLDLDERRYDSPAHDQAAHDTWHDVQLLIDGGAMAEAAGQHLDSFLGTIEGRRAPPPQAGVLRTISRKRKWQPLHLGPEPVLAELRAAHMARIAAARRLIYLETQYFRDRGLAEALARAAKANPDLTLILILPGAPDDLAFSKRPGLDVRGGEWVQAGCLRILTRAFGPRVFIGGPAQRRRWRERLRPHGRDFLHGAPIIYVHAKVSIFDDAAAIVSSANLNGRSLRWDTEAGVELTDPATVTALRTRVMSHWLPPSPSPGLLTPDRAVALWRALAVKNARRTPALREGFLLPYSIRAAERDGRRVPLLPEELV